MIGTNIPSRFTFFLLFVMNPSFLFSSNHSFAQVDSHALGTPDHASRSLLQLTHYLTTPFDEDLLKARAIFRWITDNITYDIDAYRTGQATANSPDDVLTQRRSVCEGYARLFERIAKIAGLEAGLVGGFSKGYQYNADNVFGRRSSHAWNAVMLDGEWYLLDVTWGAGYIDENGKYVKRFNEYYFLTPPEELIQSHFPNQKRWQLLDESWSKDKFSKTVVIKSAFFNYNLTIIEHKNYLVHTGQKLTIKFSGPDDVRLLGRIYFGDNELTEQFTFSQKVGNEHKIYTLFPEPADYLVRIFANQNVESPIYEGILEYKVVAKFSERNQVGFPDKYSGFSEFKCLLFEPSDRFLYSDSVYFRLKSTLADQIIVKTGEKIHALNKQETIFSGLIGVEKGEVIIAASTNGDKTYHYLLRYLR